MRKSQNRTIGVITILLMLGVSPLSVTYSFADLGDYQKDDNPNVSKNIQNNGLGVILTEKIVNGKLEVRHYALPDDISDDDMQRMLSFEDQISGWAYMNYKTFHSGIVLFDGKASKVGEDLWKISTNGELSLEERQFDLKLNGKSNDPHVIMHEIASDKDLSYKVIFSGKIVDIDEENVFVISFMNLGIKNPEMDQNIKFLQIGESTRNSEKPIDSKQEFRSSISVR